MKAVIEHSETVPYSADEMYQLVDKVEEYANFLPWCRASKVQERGEDYVIATLSMAKGPLHHDLTTRNEYKPNHYISMDLIDGPFKTLQGMWQFEQRSETSCEVHFFLEYTFHNRIVAMALNPVLQSIISPLVYSFLKRAESVYGKR